MAMSKEHKEALAKGRNESRAIKGYLSAIQSRRPGRPVTQESLKARLANIDSKLASTDDPLRRVDLLQTRIDIETALASVPQKVDIGRLEADFVAAVGSYSERKGISYSAWREFGVPAEVLKKAGIAQTRRR